jgi:glyoxylase I family protein
MFNSIHHIAIICSDYEKSKDFYVNKLEFKIIKEIYRREKDSYKLDLEISGRYQLELFSFPNTPGRVNRPEACGLRHLAFETNNVEKKVEEMRKKGIETEPIRVDEYTNKKFTFFFDPDGLPLEVYEN